MSHEHEHEGGAGIHGAILAVMRDVGYVQKGGRVDSPGAKYTYTGEADLIAALRPSLLEHGIYCYVKAATVASRAEFSTRSGSVQQSTVVKMGVRFVHAETGTFIDVETVGEGADSGDKSVPKAMTGAFKYSLRETFCIETGDDPDKDASEERRASRPQEARRPAPDSRPPQRQSTADDGYYDEPPAPTAGVGANGPERTCPSCDNHGVTMKFWKPGSKAPDLECRTCTEEYEGKRRPLRWWSFPAGVK